MRAVLMTMLGLLAAGCSFTGPSHPVTERLVGTPGESCPTLTDDGAWCWIQDPRAVTFKGKQTRTYVGWVDSVGDIQVAAYDHATGAIETATLREKVDADDHASPAILVRPDGRIMAFFTRHRGREMFYRVTVRPEDISEWTHIGGVGPHTNDLRGFTYPSPIQLQREPGRVYVFYRDPSYRSGFATSDDGGTTWSAETVLIENGKQRPYVKYESDGVAAIHLAFTEANPAEAPGTGIFYACYRDGALWRADGSRIKSKEDFPLLPHEADRVYDPSLSNAAAWIWDIALERSGNPVIVYAVFQAPDDHRYRYARWTGAAWEDHEITAAGPWFPTAQEASMQFTTFYSGGIALDHEDPSVVYLSRKSTGVFEIEKWSTMDGGLTWTSEPVTAGSAQNNVRPCVPRGHLPGGPEVLWMNGDYVTWTEYRTSLRMK